MEFTPEQINPVDIKLKRAEQELHITWADGSSSVLSARTLRRNCPCATCAAERKNAGPLRVLNVSSDRPLEMTSAQLMGHYALGICWSDGHDTGIFEFRYLRELAANPSPPA